MSVTYRTPSGALASDRTAGTDGAYLVVLPYTPGHLQGDAMIGTGLSGGPIVSVRYDDGHTCSTSDDHTCPPVGYRSSGAARVSAARVRSAISARSFSASAA